MITTLPCTGPNAKHAEQLVKTAKAYGMLAKFYSMSAVNQRIFMALFDTICKEREQEQETEQ